MLTMVFFFAVVPSAPAQKPSPFVAQMDYWVRDGGEWRCANPDFRAGGEEAKEFGYRFAWGLHRRAVMLEIFGEFEDGRRITFWYNVAAWHPGEKRVVMTHLGLSGAVMHGHEEMPDENTREHEFTGVGPDGSEFRFKDIARITGPDTHESLSFRWENGSWIEQRKMQWRRVRPAG